MQPTLELKPTLAQDQELNSRRVHVIERTLGKEVTPEQVSIAPNHETIRGLENVSEKMQLDVLETFNHMAPVTDELIEEHKLPEGYKLPELGEFSDRIQALSPIYDALGQVDGAKPKIIFVPRGLRHSEKDTLIAGNEIDSGTSSVSNGIARRVKYKSTEHGIDWDIAVVDDNDSPLFPGISLDGKEGEFKDELVTTLTSLPGVKERLRKNFTTEDIIRKVSPDEDTYLAHQLDRMMRIREIEDGVKSKISQIDHDGDYTIGKGSMRDENDMPVPVVFNWDSANNKINILAPSTDLANTNPRNGLRPVFLGRDYTREPSEIAREDLEEAVGVPLGKVGSLIALGENGYSFKSPDTEDDRTAEIKFTRTLDSEAVKSLVELTPEYRSALLKPYIEATRATKDLPEQDKPPEIKLFMEEAKNLRNWYEVSLEGGDHPELVYVPVNATKGEWDKLVMSKAHRKAITSQAGYDTFNNSHNMGSSRPKNGSLEWTLVVVSHPRKGYRVTGGAGKTGLAIAPFSLKNNKGLNFITFMVYY